MLPHVSFSQTTPVATADGRKIEPDAIDRHIRQRLRDAAVVPGIAVGIIEANQKDGLPWQNVSDREGE